MKNRRFAFWKTFWVVLAVYLVFATIGLVAATLAPTQEKDFNMEDFFTWKNAVSQVVTFFFVVCYYYFTLNIFYRLIQQRKEVIEYVKVCVIILIVLGLYYSATFTFFKSQDLDIKITPAMMVFSYSIATVGYIGVSLLISYLVYLRDEKKQRKILEEQKMQLEVEKSQANFNFLKAQINPHFLHNTLNFLYAKSLPYSTELSEGILTLSDIMRYALSEGNARNGKAPLRDEIEHVRNVIKINQLRFSNNLNVQCEVEGVINGAEIIPFVLITLVENAFKHGDLKTSEHPIIIKVKVDDGKLYFYCHNKKKSGPRNYLQVLDWITSGRDSSLLMGIISSSM
jgi:two-component system, LytTR family, sensor kinase